MGRIADTGALIDRDLAHYYNKLDRENARCEALDEYVEAKIADPYELQYALGAIDRDEVRVALHAFIYANHAPLLAAARKTLRQEVIDFWTDRFRLEEENRARDVDPEDYEERA